VTNKRTAKVAFCWFLI